MLEDGPLSIAKLSLVVFSEELCDLLALLAVEWSQQHHTVSGHCHLDLDNVQRAPWRGSKQWL